MMGARTRQEHLEVIGRGLAQTDFPFLHPAERASNSLSVLWVRPVRMLTHETAQGSAADPLGFHACEPPRNQEQYSAHIYRLPVPSVKLILRREKKNSYCLLVVLPSEMVDKSTGPFQAHLGPVCGDEAVQRDHIFPEQGCIRVLLGAPSPNTSRSHTPPLSGFGATQAEIGTKGHVSTSRAVHRRVVLSAAMAGVRCR